MANNLLKRPWIIDTPGATVLSSDKLRIQMLRWEGATTAAHQVIVQDASGRAVWTDQADAANYEAETLLDQNVDGLIVPTLASGVLRVWLALLVAALLGGCAGGGATPIGDRWFPGAILLLLALSTICLGSLTWQVRNFMVEWRRQNRQDRREDRKA